MKRTFLLTSMAALSILAINQAKAGCTGLCIHKAPLETDVSNTINNVFDTVSLSASGGVATFYASYNGSCAMLMASDNRALIWCRNGVPIDTTDMTNAVFDGVWTYTTPFLVTSPGIYTVYFKRFLLLPGYECGQIVVTQGANNASALSTTTGADKGEEFSVFPNPATIQVTILGSGTIEVLDTYGQLLMESTTTGTRTDLNIATLGKGIYFVRRKGNNDCKKLVIE